MLVRVYICQNATLLEITCRGSFIVFMKKCLEKLTILANNSGLVSSYELTPFLEGM